MEKCFTNDPEWSQKTVDYIKSNSQLNYTQIYKWGWDQKKKVEKNPNSKPVPTIDEFGGYWKFESAKIQLEKLCDEDLNEKVRLLDSECEKNLEPLTDFEPKVETVKRRKTEDSENHSINILKENTVIPKFEEENLFSPPKKPKRERYCSDMTNVTRSAVFQRQPLDQFVNPFLDEEVPSEKMGGFNFDSNDMDFDHHSFKLYNSGNTFYLLASLTSKYRPKLLFYGGETLLSKGKQFWAGLQ